MSDLAGTASADPLAAVKEPSTPTTRVWSEALILLSIGHFTVDLFSSTVATIQPVLINAFSLSLAQAGLLGGVWMFSSSVLQLPFGLISDRLHSRLFTIVSPLFTAICLTALGFVAGFGGALALALLGGIGVAAFHPQSTAQAGRVAGKRRGIATALFITAGTAGLAVGPFYLTGIIERFGFDHFWIAAVPVVVICGILYWRLPEPTVSEHEIKQGVDWAVLARERGPLALHYILVVLRSAVQVGIAQFLSIYLIREHGMNLKTASAALAIYFLSASVGSFIGGTAADKFGGKRVVVYSMIVSVPFLGAFMLTTGWLSIAALFVGGVILLTTIPVNVVMAQELAPSQAGTVTALMMGFAWGIAGIIFVPGAGWLADRIGLEAVLWGLAMLPLAGFPIALFLPDRAKHG